MNRRLLNILLLVSLGLLFTRASCKYGFTDAEPLPADIKTFRVNTFENKAQYVNPALAPELSEKVRQKIISTTKLKLVQGDDAHYDISGVITQYNVSTVGVSNNTSSTNRLTVGVHLIFKNTLYNDKNFEADLIRSTDFASNFSLQDVESGILPELITSMTDEIFNKIFSNW